VIYPIPRDVGCSKTVIPVNVSSQDQYWGKPEEAVAARRKVIAEIEQESTKAIGLRSDVVTLFEGGGYLYIATNNTPMYAWFSRQTKE